jgi:hypothetical protein
MTMATIFEAREALDKASGIIKELIMANKLVTEDQQSYSEYLNFWEEVHELLRMLDSFDEDAESVKRGLIYDTMTKEGENYYE